MDSWEMYFLAIHLTIGRLTLLIEAGQDHAEYQFVGSVDEHFRHQDVPRIRVSRIVFNLERLVHFNSCGIREWIHLLRDLEKHATIVFQNCSISMIDQINLIPDTLGGAEIKSFVAPYFCEEHGEVMRMILIDEHGTSLAAKQAPRLHCESCGKILDFDALEETYFLFTERSGKAS